MNTRVLLLLVTVILVRPGGLVAQDRALPPELIRYADVVLYNGKVLTADEKFTVAEAVAIRDGKFLKVGASGDVLPLAGPTTNKIDLAGRSVVPGFFDTHLHGAWVGNIAKKGREGTVNFRNLEKALDDIRKIVAEATPGEWIILGGPRSKNFYTLTRKDLDALGPKNPMVFVTASQEVLANSLALKIANMPKDMPGLILDKDGEPTGQTFGFASGVLSYETPPMPALDKEIIDTQKAVLRRLNSQGLTTIIGRAQGLTVSTMKELWITNQLSARVRLITEITRLNPNTEAYLKRLGNLDGFGNDMMKISGATVQPVDGTTGDGAALSEKRKIRLRPEDPYEIGANKWVSYGPIGVDLPKEKTEWNSVILANRYGWSVNGLHSQGDLATKILLQAYADADKERSIKGRHFGFDHGLLRTSENFRMAKQLDVISSIGPKYLFMGSPENLVYMYGADAVQGMTPVKSLIDQGLKPVLEADITGDYSAPLWLMEKIITRRDEKGRVWGPDEKVTRQQALWMKTLWAARYSRDEDVLGTIETGKLADLVVLGGDYLTVPEDQISKLPIVYTFVGGKIVYDLAKDGDVRTPFWDSKEAMGRMDR